MTQIIEMSTTPPGEDRSEAVLQVRDLCVDVRVDREWIRIVDDVSLDVFRGETVGLVGESGSGKTLTSLAVMGLLPDNGRLGAGEVVLDGRIISELNERQLSDVRGRDIAMIFQEPRRSLNGAFTVGDQIAEVVRRHKDVSRREAWRQAVAMLDRVGIANATRRVKQYPHEFSGGMCQRVMLGMALVCEPKVLVADEPTTALDVTVQRQVLELMADLQRDMGLGVLLITHDLGVVAEVCDRVSVMYAGQVVEQAPVEELFERPRHPYTAGLLKSAPDAARHGELLGYIPGIVPPPTEFGETCRFAPRCSWAQPTCVDHPLRLRDIGYGRTVRCARAEELDLSEHHV
jgi:peptide/nickel transport system ATP-binding protein